MIEGVLSREDEEKQSKLKQAGRKVTFLFFLIYFVIGSFFKYYVGENLPTSLIVGLFLSIMVTAVIWAFVQAKIESNT